jgi:hypothetical protein
MVAYPGVDPLDLTYIRFQALLDSIPGAKAFADSRITENQYDALEADRMNREIVAKMWFPTLFPEDQPE